MAARTPAGVALPEGISLLEGAELEQALGHTLSRCRCASDWPVELNHGVSQQILALRIRGKVPPVELVMVASDAMLVPTRVLLLVEEKAELEFLQVVSAKGQAAHSHLLEIHLGQESKVNHGLLALGMVARLCSPTWLWSKRRAVITPGFRVSGLVVRATGAECCAGGWPGFCFYSWSFRHRC